MGLLDRINEIFDRGRDFIPGEAAIRPSDLWFGVDPTEYSPAEYGEYIATSNAVYTCATIRSDLLKSLPLRAYKRIQDSGRGRRQISATKAGREEILNGSVVDLLRHVNPFWTFRRLIAMTELSLGLWGKSFWFLERGASGLGEPREIWWGRPDRVTIIPHGKKYISHFEYNPADGGDPIPYSIDEVIYFPYPNPNNEWDGLSPVAAARLAADTRSAAGKATRNLFAQGMIPGGFVIPAKDKTLTPEQANAIEQSIERRFAGVDKAHKWGVFRFEAEIKGASQLGLSPRDAEFLGTLEWGLEEVARAYKVPLDLIGGQRTYQNVEAALKAIWTHAIKPESEFLADELNEQLLPKFKSSAVDFLEFDLSGVEVLQEAQGDKWTRASEQIKQGAITINEWREAEGLDPLPWGDSFWAPFNLIPISTGDLQVPNLPAKTPVEDEAERSAFRYIEYGSPAHVSAWRRFDRRSASWERYFLAFVKDLLKRLQDSAVDVLKSRSKKKRTPEDAVLDPFDLTKWIKIFREAVRPVFKEIVLDAGETALADIGVELAFDIAHDAAIRFIEARSQRFAERVPDTVWRRLQESLSEGMSEGEGIPELELRVINEMSDYIRSTAETIARTEVVGALNGGTLEGYRQSGVVKMKAWLAALDDRTRDSHIVAHEKYNRDPIPIDDNFHLDGGSGPAPGQIGSGEEDINCRCTLTPVLESRSYAIEVLTGIRDRLEERNG